MRLELTLAEVERLRRCLAELLENKKLPGAEDPTLQAILDKLAEATCEVQCPVCGQVFTRQNVGRAGVYCSTACKQKAYRERRKAWRKHPGPTG